MSPRSLLFSSNEETSRQLRQALEELELQVEHCPEIFSAVEKLTGQAFDVIAVDWDEGAEASFLLKTARELKSNQAAVTIAIVNDGASFPAAVFGVNVVLRKPVLSDEIKYSLLTCDEFLAHMRTWLVPGEATATNQAAALPQEKRLQLVVPAAVEPAEPREAYPLGSSPRSSYLFSEKAPYTDDEEEELFSQSGIQSLFHSTRKFAAARKQSDISRFILIAAACVAFLAAGYAFSQPTGNNPLALALVKTYDRTLQKAHKWIHKPASDNAEDDSANTEDAADYDQPNPQSHGQMTRIRVVTLHRSAATPTNTAPVTQASSEPQPNEAQLSPTEGQPSPLSSVLRVPQSLRTPAGQTQSDNEILGNDYVTPRLAGALRPVSLTEDLAEKLLVEKVLPSYPVQAVQSRLQGPVVLQARIGRDGAIRELKLVRGSLLLGKAACDAVKRWRYKPYVLNGQAVEAQTFVTVDFRLPSEGAVQR